MNDSTMPVPLHTEKNLAALADDVLDGQLFEFAGKVEHALAERQEALHAVADCEQRAVVAAWNLGQRLLEKKRRIGFGRFGIWCAMSRARTGVSPRSARDYMRLAEHFGSAANLGSSIRKSLNAIPSKPHTPQVEPVAPAGATHTANPPMQGERSNIRLLHSQDEGAHPDNVRTMRAAHAPTSGGSLKVADEELGRTLPPPHQLDARGVVVHGSRETPVDVLDRVRVVFGRPIGCDPASNAEAQVLVRAETWYDGREGRDGLTEPWSGPLFLHPPCSESALSQFVSKLEGEITAGRVAEWLVLADLVAETEAGQTLIRMADCMCFPAGRLSFLASTEPMMNDAIGQWIIYGGPHAKRFVEVFSEIGRCAMPVAVSDQVGGSRPAAVGKEMGSST